MVTVALAYNLIHPEMIGSGPLDALAEYDSEDTIAALRTALEAGGHEVALLEADETFMERLHALRPDIVFNIAEGLRGESRESHVPAICEMLGIPYTGSDPLTLALCLNKARAKQILLQEGIATPRFRVVESSKGDLQGDLRFPLIVKLLHEGSSMGLTRESVVDDNAALQRQVHRLLKTYHEPVLIEEFIEGREFTIGLLGNESPQVLPIVELVFSEPRGIVLFEVDEAVIPLMEQQGVDKTQLVQSKHRAICPAEINPVLQAQLEETAVRAFRALGCRDWCRLEIRQGPDGELYVLELNPIAGIDPSYWLPRAAQTAGLSYSDFVNSILTHALTRNGHDFE